MINADNHYPVDALRALREQSGSALAVFDPEVLLAASNIPAGRLAQFAVVETDIHGCLRRIHEKPDEATLARLPRPLGVSMNCWRLAPPIFQACRLIGPSPRGELELPDAVQYAIDRLGERFRVIRCKSPVLDLCQPQRHRTRGPLLAGVKVDL